MILDSGTEISDEDLAKYKESFTLLDKDNDGFITAKDLGINARSLGYQWSTTVLQDSINEVDDDGSGHLGLSEFIALQIGELPSQDATEQAAQVFRMLDVKGRGVLSIDDIVAVRTALGESIERSIVEAQFDQMETNEDGEVTEAVFVQFLCGPFADYKPPKK